MEHFAAKETDTLLRRAGEDQIRAKRRSNTGFAQSSSSRQMLMLVHICWNIDSTLVRFFPIDCGFKRQLCKHFVCVCAWCCSSGSLQKAWRRIPPLVCSTTCDKFGPEDSPPCRSSTWLWSQVSGLCGRLHNDCDLIAPGRLYARRPLTPQSLAARVYNGPETCCASGCVSSLTCFHLHGRPWISMFTVFHNDG